MGIFTPRKEFLTLSRGASSRSAAEPFVLGSDGVAISDIADMKLGDIGTIGKWPPTAVSPVEKPENTTPKKLSSKQKRENILDRPLTLRRSWRWKATLASPLLLLGAGALVDKYTGGVVMLGTVDAGVSAADYAYRHIRGEVNVREAIEWGVEIAQPLKFLHTDSLGLLAKNEAAIEAKHKYGADTGKIRDSILPALFAIDYKSFMANYALRNAITLRNYPDIPFETRGMILAQGLIKDIHASYGSARELQDVPLKDSDIVTFFAKHPEILAKTPPDLRQGLKRMIEAAKPKAQATQRAPGGLVLQEWQKQALEEAALAETGPLLTPEEQHRMDQQMQRAIEADIEARRPRTLGELAAEQRRNAQQSAGRDKARATVKGMPAKITDQMNRAAQAKPTPWQTAWCAAKFQAGDRRIAKCVLGQ